MQEHGSAEDNEPAPANNEGKRIFTTKELDQLRADVVKVEDTMTKAIEAAIVAWLAGDANRDALNQAKEESEIAAAFAADAEESRKATIVAHREAKEALDAASRRVDTAVAARAKAEKNASNAGGNMERAGEELSVAKVTVKTTAGTLGAAEKEAFLQAEKNRNEMNEVKWAKRECDKCNNHVLECKSSKDMASAAIARAVTIEEARQGVRPSGASMPPPP